MASKLLPVFLAVVAACAAQQCFPQPSTCGCAPQPTVIQMTCGGASMPPPPIQPPQPPAPAPAPATEAPTEEPTTVFVADTDAQTCNNDNILAIVIDSSGSVNFQDPGNYDLFLGFAAKLATAWKKHPGNGVAVIIYSSNEELLFGIDQGSQMDEATMEQTILGAHYMGGGTATHLGLNAADAELNAHNPKNLPKNVVLITDGTSNDQTATHNAANQLAASGTNLVAVGVGQGRNMAELEAIVNNNPNQVFSAENFTDLTDLTKKISQALCAPSP